LASRWHLFAKNWHQLASISKKAILKKVMPIDANKKPIPNAASFLK
jgi:hypothetical protein